MFKGSFPAFLFFKIGAGFAVLSLVIIYWQSQIYEQEPAFPHAYISKVAQHYPEFVVFRLSTITGAVLIILGWFTNHFVLRTVALESGIDLKKYHPEVALVMGTMGGLFLTGNTASIDTGFMNTKLHVFCAGKFFIFTILAQVYNTVVCARLSQQTSGISKWNMYLKYFILGMLVLQVIDSLSKGYGFLGWLEGGSEVNSDKDKFLEWTMTATVITNFLSVGLDAIKFQFVFTEVSAREEVMEQGEGQAMEQTM